MTDRPQPLAIHVDDARPIAKTVVRNPTRPFYWSVRRELWDNRAIWIAPLITAVWLLCMFDFIMVAMAVMSRPHRVPALPYEIAPSFMLVVTAVVWTFYCLDALHSERRDRSILFWKSLPVSDLTTVLSKAAVALLVVPIVTMVITASLELALWLAHKTTGLALGVSASTPSPFPLFRSWAALLYGFAAMTLWLAPVCASFLLVSGWARRAPLVWAALPLLAIVRAEDVLFRSKHVANRWASWATEAFASTPRPGLLIDPMNPIAPAKFLGSPSLWVGLVLAALLLFAAARLRRRRSPL